jgi:hypothetical protein
MQQAGRSRFPFPMRSLILFSMYLILPAALGLGVYSASERNEYQKHKKVFLGSKALPVRKTDDLAAICEPWRIKANRSKDVDPRHIYYLKRNVPPGRYKQCATPPKKMSSFSGYTLTGDLQTHFRKTETTRNHPHQNVMVTRTQIKTLNKQQTSHILNTQTNLDLRNTTLRYGFHFQRRNSRTLPIESLGHDSGRTLVWAPNPNS